MDKIKSDIFELIDKLTPEGTVGILDEIKKATALREIAEKINEEIENERSTIRNRSKAHEDLVERLKVNNTSIKEEIAGLEAIQKTHHQLLAEEEKVKSEYSKLQQDHKNLEDLKKLKSFVTSNNAETIKLQIEQLESGIKPDIDKLSDALKTAKSYLIGIEQKYSDYLANLLEALQTAMIDLQGMLKENTNALELKIVDISSAFGEHESEINDKISDAKLKLEGMRRQYADLQNQHDGLITKMKSIKEELEKVETNHAKNMDSYRRHFNENKNIWGNIGDKHQLDAYVENLAADIERLLGGFDKKLQGILQERDSIHISELQTS